MMEMTDENTRQIREIERAVREMSGIAIESTRFVCAEQREFIRSEVHDSTRNVLADGMTTRNQIEVLHQETMRSFAVRRPLRQLSIGNGFNHILGSSP